MTYYCKYRNNPTFPYASSSILRSDQQKKDEPSLFESSLFNSIFSPIEKLLGRKIEFDDILLVVIIYVIFTEKNKENNTLLLSLLFVLLS